MITLYGIANCATVKKARTWLEQNDIAFEFIDFKKQKPNIEELQTWCDALSLAVLLNKRGTTWRKLTEQEQQNAQNPAEALRLMSENPSLIKRPVLIYQNQIFCGFSDEKYAEIFGK